MVVVVINIARPYPTSGQSRISALVLGGGSSRLWTRVGPSCSSVPRIWSMLSLRTVRNVFQQSLITKDCKLSYFLSSFQVHLGSRRKLKAVRKMSLTLSTPCLQSCPQLRVNIIINYNNNNSETKDAQTCRWWEDLPSQGAKTKMHEKQLRSPRFSQALNFERLHLQGFCTLRTFFEEVEHFLLSSH